MESTMKPRLKISVVASIVVARDAVSNIVLQQLDTVTRWTRQQGISADVRLFTMGTDIEDSRIYLTHEPAALLRDHHFLESDLILYNFAIFYPIFDTIQLAPRSARVVVFHHGVTPPSCFSPENRDLMYRSFQQTVSFRCADLIMTSSHHLKQDLVGMGHEPSRVVRSPYWVPVADQPLERPRAWSKDELKLIYLGRFSPAKGLGELIRAVDLARTRLDCPVQVRLVGSQRFSSPGYVDSLREEVGRRGLSDVMQFHLDVSNEEVVRHLRESDVMVLPSHHEGFCVPVLESLANGTFVICSDAGALPETAGGLGLLHPVGNASAMADCLVRFRKAWRTGRVIGDKDEWTPDQWQALVLQHLSQYTKVSAEADFERFLFDRMTPTPERLQQGLRKCYDRLMDALAAPPPPVPTQHTAPGNAVHQVMRQGFRPRSGYGKYAA